MKLLKMGILFNIFALWTSICLTALVMGFALNFVKRDYIEFIIGALIGGVLMIITVLLREIFPKLNITGLL